MQLAYSLIATGYSKEEAFEADAWAYHTVLAAGGQREEILAAVARLADHCEQHASEPVMPETDDLPGKLLWEIKNHLQTHPPPSERLQALEAISG